MSSNRSPSPLARPNPNSRNSETNSNIRRSFNGNPFGVRPSALTNPRSSNPIAPANSPADHSRRHSLGKEGGNLRVVHDEKENENEKAAPRFRSPAKGSKHFMSPTISAASKFTPSPRKKVLTERNVAVGSSVQFSDGVSPLLMEDTDVKAERVLDQVKIDSSLDSDRKEVINEVPSISQVTQSSEITDISDHVDVESFSKPVCSSAISPIIAPLDADPSRPPYDPQNNFLSPRPQFLHYKPNPRIEIILNKEREGEFGDGGGLKLEDSFILSENSSDTDVTGESQSEHSQKESEDLSSADETSSEEEGVPIFAETIPISTPPTHELASEAKRSSNQPFFTRAKLVSLLLVFLIACASVSVIDSPVMVSSVFKDVKLPKLYDSSEVAAIAKSNLHEFARSFRQWSANSISFVNDLVLHFSRVDDFGPIQFFNLSSIPPQENLLVDGYIGFNFDADKLEESHGKEDWEMVNEGHVEDEILDYLRAYDNSEEELESAGDLKEIQAEEENFLQSHLASPGDAELPIDTSGEEDQPVLAPQVAEMPAEVEPFEELESASDIKVGEIEQEIQTEEVSSLQSDIASTGNAELPIDTSGEEDQPAVLAPQVAEIPAELPEFKSEQEVSDVNPESVAVDLASGAGIESTVVDTSAELSSQITPSEPLSSPRSRTADIFSPHIMIGVYMLVSLVAATGVFKYLKQRKSSVPVAAPQAESLQAVTKLVSQNWEAEVDVVAESCPSEMSSFQKSSSYSKRVARETNEAQGSHEKKRRTNNKRESLASSSEFSMGSPSYGSFTTYERIPIKHAYGEEEIVTPVRRSSRIRSHVTSS